MNISREAALHLFNLWLECVTMMLNRLERLVTYKRPPTPEENADGRYTHGHTIELVDDEHPAWQDDDDARVRYHQLNLAKGILRALVDDLEKTNGDMLAVTTVLNAVKLLRAVGVRTHRLSHAVLIDVA
jgi:hypothetical protein